MAACKTKCMYCMLIESYISLKCSRCIYEVYQIYLFSMVFARAHAHCTRGKKCDRIFPPFDMYIFIAFKAMWLFSLIYYSVNASRVHFFLSCAHKKKFNEHFIKMLLFCIAFLPENPCTLSGWRA